MDSSEISESLIVIKDNNGLKYKEQLNLNFDYEINKYNIVDKDLSNIMLVKKDSLLKLDLNTGNKFQDELVERFYRCKSNVSCLKKNLLKSLVSKRKIRFRNNKFDLDLVYITKRVIAMGFPSYGCERIYRNSHVDVKKFFTEVLEDKCKIYNLCIEPDRIYNKCIFPDNKVALFPFADHNACPIKLMVEFCVDVSLFLLENNEHTAIIHCKAGKGRTGVMICAYLIFSGVCKNTMEAIESYGERRSWINKGVTIPSQKRYIHHFETFLSCNFETPYYKMIPKICRNHITISNNLLYNLIRDKKYYEYINLFKIKKIKIGPFKEKVYLDIQIFDFRKGIIFDSSSPKQKVSTKFSIKEELDGKNSIYYSIMEFTENFLIDSDIKLRVSTSKFSFFLWINFFYITLENFLIILNDYLSDVIEFNPSSSKKTSDFKSRKDLKSPNLIEMCDFTTIKKKTTKNINETITIKEENTLKYKTCFDVNFYWKNDLVYQHQKIKEFLQKNVKFNDNIQLFDLNNIYSYFVKKNSAYFENSKKKFKIKFDAFGVDKFRLRDKMSKDFVVEISYILI